MQYKYKVSIIIPCYNVKSWLANCLQSLVDQILQQIEIICVNDASTDSTAETLNEWQREYPDKIKVIHQQTNIGLANARNAGMQIAQGEFIGFIDADDWVDSSTFELLYDHAISNNLDIAMVKFKKYYSKNHIEIIDEFQLFDNINIYNQQLHKKNIGDLFLAITRLCGCIFSSDFLHSNNIKMLPYKCYFAEEMPFIFQCIVAVKQVGVIDEYLYYYRKNRKNQLTQQFDKRQFCVFDEFNYIMHNISYKDNIYLQQAIVTKQILVHITSIKHLQPKLRMQYAINAAYDIFTNHNIVNIYKTAIKLTFNRKLLYLPIITVLNIVYLVKKPSNKQLSVIQ
jgi:glycosyltransferase involved in cell wall biosynthesis